MTNFAKRIDIALNVITKRRRFVYIEMTEDEYNRLRSSEPQDGIHITMHRSMTADRAAQIIRELAKLPTSSEKIIDQILNQ